MGKPVSRKFFIVAVLVLASFAYLSSLVFDQLTLQWFTRDLEMRSQLAASAISGPLEQAFAKGDLQESQAILESVARDERLYAAALCGSSGAPMAGSRYFPKTYSCEETDRLETRVIREASRQLHLTVVPLDVTRSPNTALLFLHDMSFAAKRSRESSLYIYLLFFVLTLLGASALIVAVRFAWRTWLVDVQTVIRGKGEVSAAPSSVESHWLPVVQELRALVSELEGERKLYDGTRVVWNPATLKALLSERLSGEQILVVSNREPYIHTRIGDRLEVQLPASGLVTALEPIMRACSGVWIAHGSGSADQEVVDEHDRIWVPPGEHSYQIRRLWLSPEEENGYYYGFANEGLWPLCHIAHNRPIFRTEDWEFYREVNRRFADAVAQEAHREDPVVLVQDYHFALLPHLIRERLPKATIITFWHIPWPNPEAFGICPWREDILRGLVGSTIIGFHTRFHSNNFLDSLDRFIECRIDREHSTVSHMGETSAVRSYPISIEWPPSTLAEVPSVADCRHAVLTRHRLAARTKIAIGVDRLDYTKGIIERFAAVERLLQLQPALQGAFSLIQIAAPSRSKIAAYAQFEARVEEEAQRINSKFPGPAPAIILIKQNLGHAAVFEYFRAADVCMVTSLHDGMNLVAKEFVATRSDEQGVLLLSSFTGASRELPEALIVNPYDADESAKALLLALNMPSDEQKQRMRSMRDQVKEFNVFRWAGRMLIDAAQVRERLRVLSGPLASNT